MFESSAMTPSIINEQKQYNMYEEKEQSEKFKKSIHLDDKYFVTHEVPETY